jgi:hypothetical protein
MTFFNKCFPLLFDSTFCSLEYFSVRSVGISFKISAKALACEISVEANLSVRTFPLAFSCKSFNNSGFSLR